MSYTTKTEIAVARYAIAFDRWLGTGDAITAAQWQVEGGDDLTVDDHTLDGNVAQVTVSGGTEGRKYKLRCLADSRVGLRFVDSISLRVIQR